MNEEARPTRRELQFDTLDEAVAEARRLLETGYDRAGNWSLAGVCDHLTRFMRFSLDGFPRRLVPWPLTVLTRWMFLRKIERGAPMPAGLPTAPFLLPAAMSQTHESIARRADEEAVERFAREVARVEARVREGGAFHPSPIFGRLPAGTWEKVHRVHAALHLGFLVPKQSA